MSPPATVNHGGPKCIITARKAKNAVLMNKELETGIR
jgi:hypothetical protein